MATKHLARFAAGTAAKKAAKTAASARVKPKPVSAPPFETPPETPEQLRARGTESWGSMTDKADHIVWAAEAVAVFQKHSRSGDEVQPIREQVQRCGRDSTNTRNAR